MQVAIHLGAHCTDEDRLLRSLLQNIDVLSKQGINVPGPSRYRNILRKASTALKGDPPSDDTLETIREAILDDDQAERVVLFNDDFICVHSRIFENSLLYEKSNYKAEWLRALFPDDQVEFFIGIRNPATFIPAAFHHKKQTLGDFYDFINNTDLTDIRWSDVILSIQESNPGCPITVWCNEDTPLIWPEVMQDISGVEPFTRLMGGFNILGTIMHRDGMRRLRGYLHSHPPQTETQRRRIIAAFLDKFAITDEIEEELDVPGWTEELVEELTDHYEEDLYEIQKMPGVKFIAP